MMGKKVLVFIVIIVLAAGVGVGAYFMTSKDNKSSDSQETSGTAKVKEEKEENVEYLEFPEASEEDRQVLERYSNNNDYKVIPVSGSKFEGYLVAIYEPKRMHVVASSKIGAAGEYVTKMVKDNDAIVGINAGGFADPNFDGDGGTPLGITITKNRMITTDKYSDSRGGIIGFNANNELVLEALDSKSVVSKGMRDCISFGPYLVKDGQAKEMTGSGAFGPKGRAARSVIGQREDGIVLLLCVDGDRTKDEGATLGEVTEIMQKYGATNVANLDGGTSCQLVVDDEMINDPTSLEGEHRSRPVATAFILDSDESNDGDSSAVK